MSRIFYQQEGVTLIHGDCRETGLEEGSVNLVITDPPFGVGFSSYGGLVNDRPKPWEYAEFTREWLLESLRVLKPGGQLFSLMPSNMMPWWLASIQDLWVEHRGHILAWAKTMAHLHREKTFIRAWEPCLWLTKGGRPNVFRRLYRFAEDKDWLVGPSAIGETQGRGFRWMRRHPTPRPQWFWSYLLLRATEPGMVVLDPMCGTGGAGLATRKLGRKFVGVDHNAEYLAMAAKALGQAVMPVGAVAERLDIFDQRELIRQWESSEVKDYVADGPKPVGGAGAAG